MNECHLDNEEGSTALAHLLLGRYMGWDGFGRRGASTPEEGAFQRGGYFDRYAPRYPGCGTCASEGGHRRGRCPRERKRERQQGSDQWSRCVSVSGPASSHCQSARCAPTFPTFNIFCERHEVPQAGRESPPAPCFREEIARARTNSVCTSIKYSRHRRHMCGYSAGAGIRKHVV